MRPSDRFFKDFQLTSYSSAGWKPWLARFVATPSPIHLIQTDTIVLNRHMPAEEDTNRMAESYQRKHSRGHQGKEFFGDRAPISAPVRTASRDSSVVSVGNASVVKRANWRRIAGARASNGLK